MEKISLLVDTDIFIDYFNTGLFSNILENKNLIIYYSVVSEKELLSKRSLRNSEKEAIIYTLKNYRKIYLNEGIALKYSELRKQYPSIDKEDTLIAATALVKNLPLLTRNYRHYRKIKGLILVRNHKK
ncbi:MAG: PIN domain-containing protein [Ignavibacteriae bacterium]|nr:PIN domain-containing protein [Ignavibacteriota bacterium]